MTVIETDRLLLSQLTEQDAPFIFTLLNTPTWLASIGDRGIKTLNDARNYIAGGPVASYTQFGYGLYLTRLKATNTPIGLCGLLKRAYLDDADIGFAFLPDYTGQGYAYEAASGVMAYARTTLKLPKVVAFTTHSNQHSINLLNKLGFRFDRPIQFTNDDTEFMLFSQPGA